ncbi:MAG TPA: L-dopachrome tautomerase-related protein [Acidocella sp.]|uniref:L-dopachrome tautomerase-related protein n=1 Tax=Acidocella sp. TaxID=50710 RepID=UPI002C22DDCF|nr:L-dopachrome tautomerase-related protein [Acidocella sp.]HVE20939.1 L-dopachrome tautomerase-related protein [Acidocella sp.]
MKKVSFKKISFVASALLLAFAAGAPSMAAAALPPKFGPSLIAVKSFDHFALVGIGVSHEGRVFASAPAAKSGNKLVEVNVHTGAVTPYPNQSWNVAGNDPEHEWAVPQAMWVDKADHLWVLDSGRAVLSVGQPIPPKLVEFDLSDNQVIRSYGFQGVVAPSDSLNDVRIDLVHGYAYLTNIANKGGLVVLNLQTGASRQVLVGDRSTYADPHQHLMIRGQPAEGRDGKPVAIHADGIALSPDAAWVYYRPLTDHNYWRVPTAALIDASLTPAELAQKVQYLGAAELTGGLIMDQHGTLYGGDLEHASVVALRLDPATGKLTSKLFVRDKGRLSWADGFAISGGYLYIADSHLWEIVFKNHLPRSGPWTIFKVKLPDYVAAKSP